MFKILLQFPCYKLFNQRTCPKVVFESNHDNVKKFSRMPVRNCCLGCQGPMCGPCGPAGSRIDNCCCVGPCCVHAIGANCRGPCGELGCIHGARGGAAGSYFSCGHGCIGGCTSGLCASCCGPCCG